MSPKETYRQALAAQKAAQSQYKKQPTDENFDAYLSATEATNRAWHALVEAKHKVKLSDWRVYEARDEMEESR